VSRSGSLNLGYTYLEGKGVEQDYKQAAYWYAKAAKRGDSLAQVNLGILYSKGLGVPKDYVKAYAWSNLSAAQGDETAIINLKTISGYMTPDQIARAQELSSKIQQEIDNHNEIYNDNSDQQEAFDKKNPEIKGFGTGFIITQDGYVLTCHHVIEEANSVKVMVGGDAYSAKLIRMDESNDIALLKITGAFSALAFASKRSATMGQEVFTIGYPNPLLQGVNPKLTKGEINSLTGVMDDVRLYQISIPVQPGNSGGPLLDKDGNIDGLIVSMLNAKAALKISGSLPQNVNYAIKSSYAISLIDTLPEVSNNLLPPYATGSFEELVRRVSESIVMIIVY
jgi:S1-C subfamily serine protease